MPRFGPFIHQVYIADGFADDCDELVHRCMREDNLDYHVFCKIWKEMNMGCVYEGRTLGAEIAELSEELIHTGKHYMLKDTANFEESVVGVFIVYALLHLQPYQGFAHLRLVPEDLPAINRIEQVARRDKRYDVLYALGSILIKGPVHYHAAEREYGMDIAVRKYLEGFTTIDKLGVRPKGVFRRQNEELDILRDLDNITKKYTQAKMLISDKAQFDRNLRYINPNLPNELETSLKKLISGIHEEQYGEGSGSLDESNKISKSRQLIKEKAMKHDVKPAKHLVNSKFRKSTTIKNTSPKKEGTKTSPKKEETKTSPKKKTMELKNNMNTSAKTSAERKRRIPISPRALKKIRNNNRSENNDCLMENVESNTNINEQSKTDNDIDEPIALSTAQKTNIKKGKKGKKTLVKNDVIEQELDIEIDTLPVFIRTEDQGKLFEIEIIDHKEEPKKPVDKPTIKTYKKKQSAVKKISSMPGMSIKKIVAPEDNEPVASTSSAVDLSEIVEVIVDDNQNEGEINKTAQGKQELGIPRSRTDKRDHKRVHVKSKFKRLGMLPVANFTPHEPLDVESNDSDAEPAPSGNLELAPIEN